MNLMRSEIWSVCELVADQRELKVNLKESKNAAVTVGACVFVGSLLGGPIGLGVGGLVGTLFAYSSAKDFKSVITIMREMPEDEKERIIEHIKKCLMKIEVEKAIVFVGKALMHDNYVQNLIASELLALFGGAVKSLQG